MECSMQRNRINQCQNLQLDRQTIRYLTTTLRIQDLAQVRGGVVGADHSPQSAATGGDCAPGVCAVPPR